MESYVEVFVPKRSIEAQEDFRYFQRNYEPEKIRECLEEYDGSNGTLYFLRIPDSESVDKQSLSDEFPHLEFLAVESLREKRREDEPEKIKLSDFGRLFSIKKPRPSFA